MNKSAIAISSIIIIASFLILDNACQIKKDNDGNVIRKDKLSGVVQVGPFSEGSLYLYELTPELKPTSKNFITELNGNTGSFELDNVSLSSQYVEMKANGYYFNAVSGSISSYHLSLNAISDIKDISVVNVNLLTHLESERVKYLVQEGINFAAAKDSAQKEILSIFGMSCDNIGNSEELDISENNEGNAILLAISVILQRDKGERHLTELLSYISKNVQQDGKLEGDSLINELRYSTLNLDLAKIRSNLENQYKKMNSSVSVPDFEKYVNGFLTYTGLPPTPETLPSTNISPAGGTLNGTIKANDVTTMVSFEYGTTPAFGSTVQASPYVINGHIPTSVSAVLTGLNVATTYYFRIKAVNSRGIVYGNELTFTTLGKIPVAITLAASNISLQEATLNGTVNANDLSTSVSFEYGLTQTYGSTVSASPAQVNGNTNISTSSLISGLEVGTLYHYRVKAENSLGTVYGSDLTFTNLGKIPTAVTQNASTISNDGAILNGTVNANYLSTTVTFEYGLTQSYGSTISAIPRQVTGSLTYNVYVSISGLTPATVFHFRIKAVNYLGTVYSNDLTFKTLGDVPSIVTNSAIQILATSARLIGSVNANIFTTLVTFDFGESASYGNTVTADQNPINGYINTNVSASISGLNSETTYHFRIKAVNALGTSYGNDIVFKTPPGIIKDVDGNSYTAVGIGSQIWMMQNLLTTRFNDGTPIQLVTDDIKWAGLRTPAYCWYSNNETKYKNVYGALYNGDVIDTKETVGKNVCPMGWHTPSITEWSELISSIGGAQFAKKLMESGTAHWVPPNSDATNETLFTGLPGGSRPREFSSIGTGASFISSSNVSDYVLLYVYLVVLTEEEGARVFVYDYVEKSIGGSIRCIMDK
jgi:uncharacterized protein (TIGR02145 family)